MMNISAHETDVIVVGAGMAGLKAAFDLRAATLSTVILEARDRAGGRIHTDRTVANVPIERGAELIHTSDAETWELVRRQHLKTHAVGAQSIRLATGQWGNATHIGGDFDESLLTHEPAPHEDIVTYLATMNIERADYPMLLRLFELDSERLDRLGALAMVNRLTGQAENGEPYGEHDYWVLGGYDQLFAPLVESAPIHYNQAVKQVEWSAHGVRITTQQGVIYTARTVILTLPIGVLKAGHVRFTPELPPAKQKAIAHFGVSDIVKLAYIFAGETLPRKVDVIIDERGNPPIFWNSSVGNRHFSGEMLVGWAAGDNARELIRLGETEALALGLKSLRSALDQPDLMPLHARMIHWNDDPFTLGAYSYLPPLAENAPSALAAPIDNVLFWAGEATDTLWYSTVHGAYRSGARAAAQVRAALR